MKVPKIDVAKEDAKWNAYKTVENRLRETWFTFFALICFVLLCVCVFFCQCVDLFLNAFNGFVCSPLLTHLKFEREQ